MIKIDYKKELKHLYKPSPKSIELVDVTKMNFLMIDGQGEPMSDYGLYSSPENNPIVPENRYLWDVL